MCVCVLCWWSLLMSSLFDMIVHTTLIGQFEAPYTETRSQMRVHVHTQTHTQAATPIRPQHTHSLQTTQFTCKSTHADARAHPTSRTGTRARTNTLTHTCLHWHFRSQTGDQQQQRQRRRQLWWQKFTRYLSLYIRVCTGLLPPG